MLTPYYPPAQGKQRGQRSGGSAPFGENMADMEYTAEQRRQISGQSSGKIVVSLEYDHGIGNDDGYWVMTFTDGTEITFRFMAELTD